MDNLGTGGNRVDMGEKGPGIFGGNTEKPQELVKEKLDLSGKAKTELGSKAAEMFGIPEAPKAFESSNMPEGLKMPEGLGDSEQITDFPEMTPGMTPPEIDTEYKPLAEDGSIEGKIDKDKILTFGGDLIDKESQKQVRKVISKYKNDPFELDNKRNEMMADGLRDNYGRIFGNNNEADDAAPEGEQAKIVEFPGKKQAEVIEFSDMAEGKVV
ncbi:hypothetical protein IJG91_03220 [Candidatus Saccharibacteria bacterium]|nr:hypothetical protein [Candidatus Saccharibacteria bacterium]